MSDAAHMTLTEHLRELRKRLIYSLVSVGVGFAVMYHYSGDIFRFLIAPLLNALPAEQEKRLVYTGLSQPFMVDLKLAIFGGVFVALPFILYQIWLFVAPALYPRERRFVVPVVISAILSFLAGAAFAYYVAFPIAFRYFLGYTTEYMQPMIAVEEYLDFAAKTILGFGVMFEMPLVILFLARFGIVSPLALARNRRWAIIAIAVLAAVLTPPDALSMAVMAVPLYLLFEVSVLGARFVYRQREPLVDEQGDLISTLS